LKTNIVVEEPETLYRIVGMLAKYRYDKDYGINCRDQCIELIIHNDELGRRLIGRETGEVMLVIRYPYRNLCISTRLLDISYAKYMNELIASIILYKLLSCNDKYTYVFIIDSLSRDSLLTGYYVLKYMDRYSLGIGDRDLYDFGNYVLKLIMFKEVSTRVRELRRALRIRYDQRIYEEYINEVEKLDRITPMLTSLWEKDKEFFDNLLKIIDEEEITSDDLVKNIIGNNDLLLKITEIINSYFNRLIRRISVEYGINYELIYVDKITPIHGVDALRIDYRLKYILGYLRSNFGCSNLLIIDGEEYEILKNISSLDFISLNISAYL
jgi:hypothetical protein